MLRTIIAKFNSKCASTGNRIFKGDTIKWDSITKKVYALEATDNLENSDRNYEDGSDDAYSANYRGAHWSEEYR